MSPGTRSPRFTHRLRIRYGEVDQQGVVFNAHYVAYIDDTIENWLEGLRRDRPPELESWDFMLKKIELEWLGSARNGDRHEIDAAVRRWGNSSFEIDYVGRVGDQRVFQATVLYVSVVRGAHTPMRTPDRVRDYMGDEGALY